jgi:transcriptional regulator with XRE-family HTH domain
MGKYHDAHGGIESILLNFLCVGNKMNSVDETEFNIEFGRRLATARGIRKISQKRLGLHIGVSHQQIYKYESGENTMSPESIKKCAEILHVPIGYLYGEEESELHKARFDKNILTMAGEMYRMNPNLRKCVFSLIREINNSTEETRIEQAA